MRERKMIVFILVVVMILSTFNFAMATPTGFKTTDSDGNDVQGNQFTSKEDVYLHGTGLTPGNYYVKVTYPGNSGEIKTSLPSLVVSSSGIISPDPTSLWGLLEYGDTENNGGVYKVIIWHEDEVESDKISKTFKVKKESEPETIYDLTIVKTANDLEETSVEVGESVYYEVIITNTGNQILSIKYTDKDGKLIDDYKEFELGVNDSTTVTYQAIYEEGTVINTAKVVYDIGNGRTDTKCDKTTVTVEIPDIKYGTLLVDKHIDGNMSNEDDVFVFRIKDSNEVPAGGVVATDKINGSIDLPVGEYIITETGYGDYTPLFKTTTASVEVDTITIVDFYNYYHIDDPDPEYGTLIVYKDFVEGSPIGYQDFNFRVYSDDSLSIESIVAQTSVDYSNPETVAELAPGTYYLEEMDYQEYIEPEVREIEIVANETTHETLINEAIESIESGTIIIHKDVTNVDEDPTPFDITVTREIENGQISRQIPYEIVTQAAIVDDGTIRLTDLDEGIYHLSEAENYDYMTELFSKVIEISDDTPSAEFTFVNTLKTYDLELIKVVDDSSVYVNDTVTYTVTLENKGNQNLWVDTLTDKDGYDLDILEDDIALMTPGAIREFIYPTSYSSTGSKTNVAEAIYYDNNDYYSGEEFGSVFTVTDQAIVSVDKKSSNSKYRMTITKEADVSEVNVGDLIEYTITVKNTGNRTLTNIELTDELVGLEEVIERLLEGKSESFTAFYEATSNDLLNGKVENTAVAKDDKAPTREATATVDVKGGTPLGLPGLSIEKILLSDMNKTYSKGDIVDFKIVVTNTGTESLDNIIVEDIMAGFLQTIPSLVSGQVQEFNVSVILDKENIENFTNIATASVGNIRVSDDVLVEFVVEDIEIIEKIEVGEEIPLAVPNTGGTPMMWFYGLGALISGTGLKIIGQKKGKNK